MPCCKCSEFGWPFQQDVTYTDEAKKDYCLFHAPAEHKGMSVEDFNEQVFKRINDYTLMIETPEAGEFCDFSGTIFPGEISFKAYGEDNPLPGIVFSEAMFSSTSSFGGASFSALADFREAIFGGMAYFRAATFNNRTGFQAATFKGTAFFDAATFSGSAIFQATTFSGKANFRAATFDGQTDFEQATFGDRANFKGVQSREKALRLHSLSSASLSNLNFTSMETECFSFKGCDWPDGGLWPETQEKPDYKACEELYRSLKQKAADEHDQPMVSKWHYREKLMGLKGLLSDEQARKHFEEIESGKISLRRKAQAAAHLLRLAPGLLLSLNFWYWAISGYGEREIRAGAWLAFLAALPFVLNAFPHPIEEFPFNEQVNNALSYFPLAKDIQGQGGWLRLGKGLSQLLIALQATMFGFALRNRFRR